MKSYHLNNGRLSLYVANSPQTLAHVFVRRNHVFNRKSIFMREALEPLLGDGLFISEGQTWQERRQMEAPEFRPAKLKNFTKIMVECALEWRQRWEADFADKPLYMLTEMASLTAEVLCRSLFGDQLGSGNAEQIISGFAKYQAKVKHVDWIKVLGLPDWFPKTRQDKKTMMMAGQIHRVVDGIINAHLENTGTPDSLLAHMLTFYDSTNSDSITLEQIRNEIVVLLMAGHETTANSLSWTWYLLSEHPRVARRLHEELDCVLNGAPPAYEDLYKLTYTRAVFEEAMRLYPPVPVLSREAIEGERVGRFELPRGTLVVVAPWLLHRHEAYWEHPHHFVPERFTGEWSTKNEKYTYIPFSTGPRNCLGAAFGLTEAILCLAVLAQKFSPVLQPDYQPWYECRLTLRPTENLPMIARLRN